MECSEHNKYNNKYDIDIKAIFHNVIIYLNKDIVELQNYIFPFVYADVYVSSRLSKINSIIRDFY